MFFKRLDHTDTMINLVLLRRTTSNERKPSRDLISHGLVVNNVGVSAAYFSPPHFDRSDVGWTFAMAMATAPS